MRAEMEVVIMPWWMCLDRCLRKNCAMGPAHVSFQPTTVSLPADRCVGRRAQREQETDAEPGE